MKAKPEINKTSTWEPGETNDGPRWDTKRQDINGGISFYTQMEGSGMLREEKQGAEGYTVHNYLCKGKEVFMCNCCCCIKYVWKNHQETGNTG